MPHILKYAQQRILRSKRKQQPKKIYLSNPSRIFKIEQMEMVLWLIKLVYFFDSPLLQFDVSHFKLGLYIQFMAHDSIQNCSIHISSLRILHNDLV